MADYTASKFGVRGLWKTIQREVRDMGIRTNMIAPTFVKTMMIAQIADKLEEAGAKLGTVEAIADAALRLACNDDIDGARQTLTELRLCDIGTNSIARTRRRQRLEWQLRPSGRLRGP